MTRSRSVSVLDGAICSRGTSSPVPGSRYWTRLWWLSSRSSSIRMPVCAQHLDGRPGPERVVFLDGEVGALAGGRVVGPDLERGPPGTGRRTRVWPGGGELLAGPGLPCRREQAGGVGALPGDGADQDGQDGQPLAGPGVHPGLAVLGDLALADLVLPDGAGDGPLRPAGRVVECPLGQVEVEGADGGQAVAVADPLGACRRPPSGAVLDLEPLLPGAGDVVGQVQAGDAGVVVLEVGPEELAQVVGRVAGGSSSPAPAGARAGSPRAGRGPGGRQAGSGRSSPPGSAGRGCAARGSVAGAGEDAHGPQRPVEDLHALARRAAGRSASAA